MICILRETQIPEKFYTASKTRSIYAEIFVNPSKKEMREVAGPEGQIRFIADAKKGEMYVASEEALHYDIMDAIGRPIQRENALYGIAENDGGTWYMIEDITLEDLIYQGEVEIAEDILQNEWGWVERYVEVEGYLDSVRDMIEQQYEMEWD